MSVLRVGSMYAGLGGLDLAVEAAYAHLGDVEVAWQLDLTGHEVRRRNWPEALQIVGNVNEIAPADLPRVDIVTGGFSCKGVSVAGKGELLEHPETAATYWGLLWFVAHLRPRWVVIENTPKMLTCMRELMESHYGELGYGATWVKCKASDVGAPHRRARVFVVMVLGGRHRGVVEPSPSPSPSPEREWPTPLQSDAEDVKFNGHRRSPSLNFEARQRPWPMWNDHKASGSRNLEGSGANPGTSLTDAVRPDRAVREDVVREWATPNAGNFNESESHESHESRSRALVEAGSRPLSEPLGMQVRLRMNPGTMGEPGAAHGSVTNPDRPPPVRVLRAADASAALPEGDAGAPLPVRQAEVLRPGLLWDGAAEDEPDTGRHRQAGQAPAGRGVRAVRSNQQSEHPPRRREQAEQRPEQPADALLEVPHDGALGDRQDHAGEVATVPGVRAEEQGPRALREALPAVEEVGGPAHGEGEPVLGPGEGHRVDGRSWATPVARDYKCGELPNRVGSEALSMQAGNGKRLSAAWVECLQGLPMGWTETEGPSQLAEARALLEAPRWPRGRYPEDWDRTVPWPGYDWEPPRTLPDGPPCPGRPARLKLLGNMVNPQQGAHGIRAALRGPVQRGLFW